MKSELKRRKAGNPDVADIMAAKVKPPRLLKASEADGCPFCGEPATLIQEEESRKFKVACCHKKCHVGPVTKTHTSFKRVLKWWRFRAKRKGFLL